MFREAAVGFLLSIAAVIYFLPMLIAYGRDRPDANWVAAINLFFGWTIVGWLAALIKACAHRPTARHV
jgi:hypothetical protein